MSTGRPSTHSTGAESSPGPSPRSAVCITLRPACRYQYVTQTCRIWPVSVPLISYAVSALTGAELIGSVLRVLHFYAECRRSRTVRNSESEEKNDNVETDAQLEALIETTAEFLSVVLMEIPEVRFALLMFTNVNKQIY